MTTTAYFIGGPWDLSKKVLEREERIVMAYEPDYPLKPTLHNPTKEIVCKVHEYRVWGRTEGGAIVYEHVGI